MATTATPETIIQRLRNIWERSITILATDGGTNDGKGVEVTGTSAGAVNVAAVGGAAYDQPMPSAYVPIGQRNENGYPTFFAAKADVGSIPYTLVAQPIYGAPVSVTPSDTVDFPQVATKGPAWAIYVATAGTVKMNTPGGATTVTLAAGVEHRFAATRIYATGTTATGIVACWPQ